MMGHHDAAKQHRSDWGWNTRKFDGREVRFGSLRCGGVFIRGNAVLEDVFFGVHVEARQSSRCTDDEKEGNQQVEVETTEHSAVKAPAMDEKGGSHATVYNICKAVHLEAKGALGFGPTSHPPIHQIARASDKNGHSGCIRMVRCPRDRQYSEKDSRECHRLWQQISHPRPFHITFPMVSKSPLHKDPDMVRIRRFCCPLQAKIGNTPIR